jgi:hypothetical protein
VLGIKADLGWMWWYSPVIAALGRLRQEGLEFKILLSFLINLGMRK